MLAFPPFLLDPMNELLWCGHTRIALKPRPFAVLRYLLERPQRLVTKQELLDHFWSDVHVGDAVLKTHMAEIRRVLGDDIKSPRFIETAHRRGYRFIARVQPLTGFGSADSRI
jgi:DNA-binding winged helix-turn-helix (wHTH) protein